MDRKRILIVEDSPTMRQLLVFALRRMKDVDIVEAQDGMDGLRKVSSDHFDLALIDINMPVMDGFEATAEIRKREASGKTHIPIIAMTANAMTGDKEHCLEAGMDDFVSKPVTMDTLRTALKRWLGTGSRDDYDTPSANGHIAA